jgi:hypothetical protein
MDYYEHRLPCDATQIGRFRRDLGEDGLELLLKATPIIFVYPRLFPSLFPRFGLAVNSGLCRLLHCKYLIYQRKRPLGGVP